ncbi:inorganic phosphate transporter, partial [Halobacterium salinarum]|nr:inorganic phosphate transporter [Halobacterium salinarum]
VEGVLAYALARVLIGDRVPDHVTVPVLAGGVGYALAMIRLSVLPAPQGARATVAGVVARHLPAGVVPTTALGVAGAIAVVLAGAMYWQLRRDVTTGIHRLLVGLALAVLFTSGGSQVGLATGPLEPVFESALDLPAIYLLVLGGVGILVGGWVRSPRLIQAVAREYASLGPKRSIAAFIPAFLTAQAAIMFGYPISFNKVMISSIIGAGLVGGAADTGGVSVTKTGYTVAAWVGSMVGGAVLSFGLYRLLAAIPGLQ